MKAAKKESPPPMHRAEGYGMVRAVADHKEATVSSIRKLLQELGFTPYEPSAVIGPEKPWFYNYKQGEVTIAVDEAGQSWIAAEMIELTPFGFEDRTARMDAVLTLFGDSKDFSTKN